MRKLIPYVLFAGFIGVVAIILYIDTLDMTKAAYQLPRLVIMLVLALLAMMIVERFLQIRKAAVIMEPAPGTEPVEETAEVADGTVSPARIAVFVVLLIAYVATIKPLGYFIATPLFLVGIMAYLRATSWFRIIFIAVGFTGFVYFLFVFFLNLPVPMGILAS